MVSCITLAGKSACVSDWAAKVAKNGKLANGFFHHITGHYRNVGAVLTEGSKRLKDGRFITQKRWTWPSGQTTALTQRSDGFFSLVSKNAEGKVTREVISRGPLHLKKVGTTMSSVNGHHVRIPYSTHVDGNYYARFDNGKLITAGNTGNPYWVSEARRDAVQSFHCIGTPGFHS